MDLAHWLLLSVIRELIRFNWSRFAAITASAVLTLVMPGEVVAPA